jgi:hypothetical protein
MLTRRTFLTTIAAAPLAKFCKTEPVEVPFKIDRERGIIHFERPVFGGHRCWVARKRVEHKADVERRYGLPQGTLG